jgi:hypothetical protein
MAVCASAALVPSEARADYGCPGSYNGKACGDTCYAAGPSLLSVDCDLTGGSGATLLEAYRSGSTNYMYAGGNDSNGVDFCCKMTNEDDYLAECPW